MEKSIYNVTANVKVEGEEKGKRVVVAKVPYLCPQFSDFADVITMTPEKDEDGNLVWKDKRAKFLADAIQTATEEILAKCLKPKSDEYLSGCSAWTSIDGLVAGVNTTRETKAQVKKGFLASFTAWVLSLGKPEAQSSALVEFARDSVSLSTTNAHNKGIFNKLLDKYYDTLLDSEKERYYDTLVELATICSTEEFQLSA